MTATLDLTITKPGGTSPLDLTATGISASWVVRPQGTFSAEVLTSDLVDAAGTIDLRGRWLSWQHPSLPTWAGVIVSCEADGSTGTTEIAARDFTELLAARRTAKVYQLPASSAGGLAQRVVLDAGRDAPTWLTDIAIDPGGRQVPLAANAEQVRDVVARLADDSGHEWTVTADRVLTWRQRLGTDNRATVQLVEGVQLTTWRLSLLIDPVVNDLLAIPSDAAYQQTRAIVREDATSVRAIGRRQGSQVYDQMLTRAQLEPAADADLDRLTIAGQTLTADIAPSVQDIVARDPYGGGSYGSGGYGGIARYEPSAWSLLDPGDTVSVVLPSADWSGAVRVMVMQYDSERNILSISAEVQP